MKKQNLILIFIVTFFAGLFAIVKADDLASLSVDFCTGEVDSAIAMQIDPGQETGICYTLSNGGINPVDVKVGFVDGGFTNDQRKNKACFLDTQIETFGKYVTGYDAIVSLKPGQKVNHIAKLKYPLGSDGVYHGCLAYSLITKQASLKDQGGNITIQMRRGKFIDVLVGNLSGLLDKQLVILEDFTAEDGDNLSNNPKIRIYKDPSDDKYTIALKIKNISMMDQNVVVTGVATNLVTYKNRFVIDRMLNKSSSLLVTQKLDEIPNFNLRVKLNLSYEAKVFGDQSVKGGLKESTNLWIFNLVTIFSIVGLVVVVGIIYLLVKDIEMHTLKPRSRKKK